MLAFRNIIYVCIPCTERGAEEFVFPTRLN